MLEANARKLRDFFLILAIAVFAVGLVDVFMLAFDLSFGTGVMVRMGIKPHSIAQAGSFLVLTSIAFGVIELNRSK